MVKRSNLDGTSPETVASGLNYAYGITVDSTNGHIYFSDLDGKGIYRSDLDGNNKITLFSNLGRPLNLVLDIPNQHIYWSDENTGKIERGNLDGTGRADVVTGLGMPIGLAILLESSNSPPTDLNTIAPLTIGKQPVGTVMGNSTQLRDG